MSSINPNSANYTNQNQLDFATEMAKFLAKKKGFQMDSKMAVLPGSWRYGMPDSLDAIIGGLYQNKMNQASVDIDANRYGLPTSPQPPSTVGTALSSSLGAQLRKLWPGQNSAVPTLKQISRGKTSDEGIETGSLDADNQPPVDREKLGLGDQGVSPGEVGNQYQRDPTSNRDIVDMTDPNAEYNKRDRKVAPKRIVMHWDELNPEGLVQYGRQVDPKRGFDPGYHYIIGRDGTIVQAAPDNKVTNHARNNNG